jgi:hypothetical protein
MKLGHEKIKEMLPEYLKGSLSREMRNDVDAHLKECQGCKEEFAFITDIYDIDVPDPGDLFYKTLPQRVTAEAKNKSERTFSWRLLFRPIPIAATIAALLVVVFTFTMLRRETPEFDPFFKGPLEVAVLDYGDITERDIPLIIERLNGDESYLLSEDFMEHSYYKEFASLSSKDLGSLFEVLNKEQKNGG